MAPGESAAPRASLSVTDGVAMLVGMIVGIGIFRTSQQVALNVDSEWTFIGLWVLGGLATLIGAPVILSGIYLGARAELG